MVGRGLGNLLGEDLGGRLGLAGGCRRCSSSGVPRHLRIQYPGAIYHLMSRGDRREDSLLDDVDRQDFVKTPVEACLKADWQVHGDSVHLSPVRGRLLKAEARFLACAWSRRGWYVAAPERRPRWRRGARWPDAKKTTLRACVCKETTLTIRRIAARLRLATSPSAQVRLALWMGWHAASRSEAGGRRMEPHGNRPK